MGRGGEDQRRRSRLPSPRPVRRDRRGDFPEWELSVQAFDQKTADGLDFDVLDPTKLIPEEIVPLEPSARWCSNRNPDNFFAETEQVAFHPGHVVPGIDFSERSAAPGPPVLVPRHAAQPAGRAELPRDSDQPAEVPDAELPARRHHANGDRQGRVAYEPNSLDPHSAARDPRADSPRTRPKTSRGAKVRERPETFADHYSQARMFFRSMTEPEQRHIVSAFAFELGKVETVAIRRRMLGHLAIVEPDLYHRVADALGMEGQGERIQPARQPIDLKPSPALSIVQKAPRTLEGRTIGVLVSDGTDRVLVDALRAAVDKAGARLAVVAPKIGGVAAADGKRIDADHALAAAPSIFFDAVVMAPCRWWRIQLREAAAIDWVRRVRTPQGDRP